MGRKSVTNWSVVRWPSSFSSVYMKVVWRDGGVPFRGPVVVIRVDPIPAIRPFLSKLVERACRVTSEELFQFCACEASRFASHIDRMHGRRSSEQCPESIRQFQRLAHGIFPFVLSFVSLLGNAVLCGVRVGRDMNGPS